MSAVFLPGSRIGVLGDGQLGQMFARAARQMGYPVTIFSPCPHTRADQTDCRDPQCAFADEDSLRKFCASVDVVTFEFEHLPISTVETIEKFVPIYPDPKILFTTQDRIKEKNFLRELGMPLADFRLVNSPDDLHSVVLDLGFPIVLKTSRSGYDGKGQHRINSPADFPQVLSSFNGTPQVAERLVALAGEFSWLVCRGRTGEIVEMGPFSNTHSNHILESTQYPAKLKAEHVSHSREIARDIALELGLRGVICVEFFLTQDDQILVNELAPRPHNSGHLTIEACVTSQFQQQVRAVCGLPLGCGQMRSPAAMVNLLGDLWSNGTPNWAGAFGLSDVTVHLYDKPLPKNGRKMGHLTALADNADVALDRLRLAMSILRQID